MSTPSPHLYQKAAIAAGVSASVARRAGSVSRDIQASGAFPVLTLRHLAHETGASYGYLRRIVKRYADEYQSIRRIKRDGTFRLISAPNPMLMDVQRWILEHILNTLPRHPGSFAYHRGIGIRQCAELHVGSRWLVKMDLHNFFGEIRENRVYRVFRQLNYPALLSFEMARLCTRLDRIDPFTEAVERGVGSYDDGRLGRLPQGAPTSGALANRVATDLDNELQNLADGSGFIYSRYSDDLTFSSPAPFSRPEGMRLISAVSRAASLAGFEPHRRKTRLVPPGARKIVLGLLVSDTGVKLLPEFRRQTQNHIRAAGKFGIQQHSSKRNFHSVLSMINHVDGRLAFAYGIDPEWTIPEMLAWTEVLEMNGYPSVAKA
ncbi:reverse transcriptase family protein [Cryobacterium gelidum]|uniref:RNA-directed DNA polymerase n=1 Tax=Cryobacterium gelidum TaxID=1259164 RepID=A0A4V3ITN7_9MICO|nr:reverse transcriptase family protein [Cryobacterium gelidum]TFD68201.1 RNA-directed DNA polymerase [Cryobacterium gelidum]